MRTPDGWKVGINVEHSSMHSIRPDGTWLRARYFDGCVEVWQEAMGDGPGMVRIVEVEIRNSHEATALASFIEQWARIPDGWKP